MKDSLKFQQIDDAEKRIKAYIYETPLDESLLLSNHTGVNIYLKCEHLQKTGSFKIRGALNKILTLSDKEKSKGVLAASTGNHGQGVALAAKIAGIKATIYVPADVSPMKLRSIKSLGAKIELCQCDPLQTEIRARQIAEETQITFISPYNDPLVIAGQGTIGIELLRQPQQLDAVFVAVGGGGLISGIASYLKHFNPSVQIIGCWPENSPAMYECIKAGKIIDVPEKPTLSDGTVGGVEPGAITFPMCKELIDQHVLVSENEIIEAMRLMVDYERTIIEGAAGVALAAVIKMANAFKSKKVAVVLCGRNIAFEKFKEIMM